MKKKTTKKSGKVSKPAKGKVKVLKEAELLIVTGGRGPITAVDQI